MVQCFYRCSKGDSSETCNYKIMWLEKYFGTSPEVLKITLKTDQVFLVSFLSLLILYLNILSKSATSAFLSNVGNSLIHKFTRKEFVVAHVQTMWSKERNGQNALAQVCGSRFNSLYFIRNIYNFRFVLNSKPQVPPCNSYILCNTLS